MTGWSQRWWLLEEQEKKRWYRYRPLRLALPFGFHAYIFQSLFHLFQIFTINLGDSLNRYTIISPRFCSQAFLGFDRQPIYWPKTIILFRFNCVQDQPISYIREILRTFTNHFDDILFDTSPTVGGLQEWAIWAADLVIIPTATEFASLDSLSKTVGTIQILEAV